jgi:hypothetical protein
MTNGQIRKAVIGGIASWFVLGLLLDRYVLRQYAPWFSNLFYFRDAEIVVRPYSRKIAWLGLSLVLVTPSVLVGICFPVYLRLKKRATTAEGFAIFGLTAFWFLSIPVIVWAGDVVYRFLKMALATSAWAEGVVAFLDGFVFKGDLYVYSFRVFTIDSGLGALAGLIAGIALLYKKGLWDTLRARLT